MAAILAVILGAVALTTGEPEQQATGEPGERTPSFALTDAEAIERFEELDEIGLRAYRSRDLSLVSLYVTSDSPLREVGEREIKQLLRDGVMYRPFIRTRSLEVIRNTSQEIVLRHESVETPRFFSESGEDVTENRRSIYEVTDWTMHLQGDTWKIFDAKVVESRLIPKNGQ